MKKNKYFEFKVSKKLVVSLSILISFVALSSTAYALYLDEIVYTDEAPVIKVSSGTYYKGDFTEPQVTASDKEDGDLTDKITYTSRVYYMGKLVNEFKDLPYPDINSDRANTDSTVTASVTDSNGNTTSTTINYREAGIKENPLLNR